MTTCEKLRSGQDNSCVSVIKKYYQQVVLVNREDLINHRIVSSSVSISDEYDCAHRVYFQLAEDKSGFLFKIGETANYIQASASKKFDDGIPQYSHSVNIALLGVTEEVKRILSQLDYGDYFAALQFYDGTIEIFGFEFGLTTNDYNYSPGETGGAMLTLRSLADSPEDDLPFVYASGAEDGEVADFDRLFLNNVWNDNGDFNDDFNDDFNNGS